MAVSSCATPLTERSDAELVEGFREGELDSLQVLLCGAQFIAQALLAGLAKFELLPGLPQ